jgi:hypothetical protein
MRREVTVDTLRIAAVTLILFAASAGSVAAQEEEPGPSAPASPVVESATPASTWLDEQTCVDPDFQMPMSASGSSEGDMFSCARALGLRKRDPDYDAYDFRLRKRSYEQERWTEQCDETGKHIGSRYHAFGTDRIYNVEKPDRVVTGTFDFRVISTLLHPDEDIWQVEKRGVLRDLHAADGDWSWTWSVDATWEFEGAPEQPSLTQHRGVARSEFAEALCEYLK